MRALQLGLTLQPGRYAICRLDPETDISHWNLSGQFSSITRTGEELSIICTETAVPEEILSEKGWRCLKLEGPFELSSIGVLVAVANPLAEAEISQFVVSTYDTDYILLKDEDIEQALEVLTRAGHLVERE